MRLRPHAITAEPSPRQPRSVVFSFYSPTVVKSVSIKLYLVTCGLLQPGDYGSLKARLRTLGARQVLANQWAVRSTYTAAQLKDILKQLVDDRDRVVVAEVGTERAELNALARAIARLPKQQRQVVRLRYDGGMSWQAIAKIMGTSVHSARKLHEEALKRLAATLQRACTDFEPDQRLHLCPSVRKRRAA